MNDEKSTNGMGTVLVTGGNGFLGSHIVSALLKIPDIGSVHVLSRNSPLNVVKDVKYHSCDLNDASKLVTILDKAQPRVIFHVASPRTTDHSVPAAEFARTNKEGTLHLVEIAKLLPAVKAFVYTSSTGVLANFPHQNLNESAPTISQESRTATPYHRSKAAGEKVVLEANGTQLATAALRICLLYGEGDTSLQPAMLNVFRNKQTTIQLGPNTAPDDFLDVDNAAQAHILTARALLKDAAGRATSVAGEVFHITDGTMRHFYDAARIIWRTAGDKTDFEKDVLVIPARLALVIASFLEWLCWLGSFGHAKPSPEFSVEAISHATREFTYDTSKARRVLHYQPVDRFKETLQRAVKSELNRHAA